MQPAPRLVTVLRSEEQRDPRTDHRADHKTGHKPGTAPGTHLGVAYSAGAFSKFRLACLHERSPWLAVAGDYRCNLADDGSASIVTTPMPVSKILTRPEMRQCGCRTVQRSRREHLGLLWCYPYSRDVADDGLTVARCRRPGAP